MSECRSDTFVFCGATGDLAYKKTLPASPAMVKRGTLNVPVIAGLRSDRESTPHDDMNIICMGGRVVEPAVARDLVDTFLAAEFSRAERHVRRLPKVAALEAQTVNS
jgi:ribose 5-phosphate isomerase B